MIFSPPNQYRSRYWLCTSIDFSGQITKLRATGIENLNSEMMRFKIRPMVNDAGDVSDSGIDLSQIRHILSGQKWGIYCACKQTGFILLAVQSSNGRLPTNSRERNR